MIRFGQKNFNLELLLSMAERFDFYVDVRGVWPIMIKGQKASEYRSHRDALNFVARQTEFASPERS